MAKRNGKTKPPQRQQRVYGEMNPDDGFVPPDRQDQQALSEAETMPVEIVDFRKGTADLVEDQGGGDNRGGDGGGTAEDEDDAPDPSLRERPRQPARAARGAERDTEGMSRSVQKRIARERAVTNRERTLREQTEAKLRDERVARQALEDRVQRVERTQKIIDTNGDLKALKAEMAALVPQIAAATEAGDTKAALALQIKHGELQTKVGTMELEIRLRSENAQAIEARETEARRARDNAGTDRQIPPGEQQENIDRGNEWKRQNRHWWRRHDQTSEQARAMSQDIDSEILEDIRDGVCEFKPYSEEHWDELAERLHEAFPDIELCDLNGDPYVFDDDEEQGDGRRREARVQNNGRRQNGNGRPPQGRNGSVRGGRKPDEVENARLGRITLTQADYDQMRVYKLDPANPDHKRAFARERARTILQEARRQEQR